MIRAATATSTKVVDRPHRDGEIFVREDGTKVRRYAVDKRSTGSGPLEHRSQSVGRPRPSSLDGVVEGEEVYINEEGKKVRRITRVEKRPKSTGRAKSVGRPEPVAVATVRAATTQPQQQQPQNDVYIREDGKKVRRVKVKSSSLPPASPKTAPTARKAAVVIPSGKIAALGVASPVPDNTTFALKPKISASPLTRPPAAPAVNAPLIVEPPPVATSTSSSSTSPCAEGEVVEESVTAVAENPFLTGAFLSKGTPGVDYSRYASGFGECLIRPDGKKVRALGKASSTYETEEPKTPKSRFAPKPRRQTLCHSDHGIPGIDPEPELFVDQATGKTVFRRRSVTDLSTLKNSDPVPPPRTFFEKVKGSMVARNIPSESQSFSEGMEPDVYRRPDGTKIRRLPKKENVQGLPPTETSSSTATPQQQQQPADSSSISSGDDSELVANSGHSWKNLRRPAPSALAC